MDNIKAMNASNRAQLLLELISETAGLDPKEKFTWQAFVNAVQKCITTGEDIRRSLLKQAEITKD